MHTPAIATAPPGTSPVQRSAYVWGIAAAAALGGLLFGYDWVVIGGARQFYEVYFRLSSEALIGWANSCALVGCLAGSLAAGYFADRLGRGRVLQVAALLFAVSSALTGWSSSFPAFIVWRIAGGVAIGLSSNVSPLYIAEISPAHIRGRLVSLNQFAIVVGIVSAQVVNWLITKTHSVEPSMPAHSWAVQYAWRWMFAAVVAPALIFTVAAFSLAAAAMASIEQSLRAEAAESTSWQELLRPLIRRIVVIGAALAVLQQWTGINILFNYAAEVYRSAGYQTGDIMLNIVITGAINLVFTVLSMLLVDRVGRRKMMMFGCIGIGASHLLCAWAYRAAWPGGAVLLLTLSAIACYALTLAPVTWVLISEIFPNRVRSQGVSIAVSALWIASFVLTYTFPMLNRSLGTSGTFFGYGVVCLVGCVLVGFSVPETSGQTLEEIESRFAVKP